MMKKRPSCVTFALAVSQPASKQASAATFFRQSDQSVRLDLFLNFSFALPFPFFLFVHGVNKHKYVCTLHDIACSISLSLLTYVTYLIMYAACLYSALARKLTASPCRALLPGVCAARPSLRALLRSGPLAAWSHSNTHVLDLAA